MRVDLFEGGIDVYGESFPFVDTIDCLSRFGKATANSFDIPKIIKNRTIVYYSKAFGIPVPRSFALPTL